MCPYWFNPAGGSSSPQERPSSFEASGLSSSNPKLGSAKLPSVNPLGERQSFHMIRGFKSSEGTPCDSQAHAYYLSLRERRSCQVFPLQCGWCPSEAASPVPPPVKTQRQQLVLFWLNHSRSSPICIIMCQHHLLYLNVFCKKLYCSGFTLEGCQLPGENTEQLALMCSST